jgi:hypothetical protein
MRALQSDGLPNKAKRARIQRPRRVSESAELIFQKTKINKPIKIIRICRVDVRRWNDEEKRNQIGFRISFLSLREEKTLRNDG